VAIFTDGGKVSVEQRTGAELSIAVRDMPMFNIRAHKHHHATIAVRDNRILLRTEIVRAVLQRHRLVLFECRCARPQQYRFRAVRLACLFMPGHTLGCATSMSMPFARHTACNVDVASRGLAVYVSRVHV
jgi:hypothetical protein